MEAVPLKQMTIMPALHAMITCTACAATDQGSKQAFPW